MKKKYLLLAIIENMQLEKNAKFQYFDWFITNNLDEINKIIPKLDTFIVSVGNIASEEFAEKVIAYKFCETELNNELALLPYQSSELNAILSLIWLNKENSFFSTFQFSQDVENFNVMINRRNDFICNSNGKYEPLLLDKNLIEEIKDYKLSSRLDKLLFTYNNDPAELSEHRFYKPDLEKYFPDFKRIQRSYLLLTVARRTDFLPMKIGFYINTLECLLLKSETELNFRLQLYTANFIGVNSEDKYKIMDIIKSGYGIRSKFFHGESLNSKKISELEDISQKIDEIVRRTIKKSIDISETINDQKKIDTYFTSLLFSS